VAAVGVELGVAVPEARAREVLVEVARRVRRAALDAAARRGRVARLARAAALPLRAVRLPAAQAVWRVRPAWAALAVVVDVAARRGLGAGVARAARRAAALPLRADPAERRERRVPQAGREVQVALARAGAARLAAVGAAARRAEVTRAARAACPGLAAGQGGRTPRRAALRVPWSRRVPVALARCNRPEARLCRCCWCALWPCSLPDDGRGSERRSQSSSSSWSRSWGTLTRLMPVWCR
jgi:hypothetical protein